MYQVDVGPIGRGGATGVVCACTSQWVRHPFIGGGCSATHLLVAGDRALAGGESAARVSQQSR